MGLNRRSGDGEAQGIAPRERDSSTPFLRPTSTIPIADVIVGERHRCDMGDIEGLAASIAKDTLLHPIVVTFDGHLIAGERRLRAVERLGWKTVPCTIVPLNLDQIVRGEFAENTCRKDFTPSELVAIGQEIERLEHTRERAKERMTLGKVSTGSESGKARDKVAAQLGISGRTYERAKAVVDAAEAEPEKFGKLLEQMDRTGRVNGVFRRLKIAKQAVLIRAEPPPLPGNGPYRVIVVDSPWPTQVRGDDPSCRRVPPFPPMSIEDICATPVADLAHDDCVLWHWTTNADLLSGDALAALKAWGFTPKTMLTWVKDRIGTGDWLRGQTEQCIMAVRGNPTVTLTNESTVLFAPARGHSAKPPEFYDLVERLCPAPRYADLFSRYRHNDKWDCHGDEAPTDPSDMPDIPAFLRRAAP